MTLCPRSWSCYICTGSERSVSLPFHCSGFLHAAWQLWGHMNVCARAARTTSKDVLVRFQVEASVCARPGRTHSHGGACKRSEQWGTGPHGSGCQQDGAALCGHIFFDAQKRVPMSRRYQQEHVSIHVHLSAHSPGGGVPSAAKH